MANEREGAGTPGTGPGIQGRRQVTPEIRRQRHESRSGSTYKNFLKELCALGNMSEEQAEEASVSVLCALERRIYSDEASQLESQLPSKLRELLVRCERHEGAPPKKFGATEFFQMVADDLNTDPGNAERCARAVITAVRAQISEGEAEDVADQLPGDLAELWRRPS
jgi:uncharacterized protein (DUF2267 family)